MNMNIDIDKGWVLKLKDEFKKPYMLRLFDLIHNSNKIIYPSFDNIFACFKITPLDKVRVVILGQDPYCLEGQAHGLAFSVLPGVPLPSSLKNIYLELYNDLDIPISNNGYLLKWAQQGVLLLNTVLTVEKNRPGAHMDIGWEVFTNKVIKLLSSLNRKILFVLWGRHAINKHVHINLKKNYIISSSHPSAKSASISFLGSRPFSKINMHLKLMGSETIDWSNF